LDSGTNEKWLTPDQFHEGDEGLRLAQPEKGECRGTHLGGKKKIKSEGGKSGAGGWARNKRKTPLSLPQLNFTKGQSPREGWGRICKTGPPLYHVHFRHRRINRPKKGLKGRGRWSEEQKRIREKENCKIGGWGPRPVSKEGGEREHELGGLPKTKIRGFVFGEKERILIYHPKLRAGNN